MKNRKHFFLPLMALLLLISLVLPAFSAVTGTATPVRLSCSSTLPVTTTNQTAVTTLYVTSGPISLRQNSVWVPYQYGGQTITASATVGDIRDVFVKPGATTGTLTYEDDSWSSSQTQYTISSATAASPCVLTMSATPTGIANGNTVFVSTNTGSGTLYTDSNYGINGQFYTVTVSGSTITLTGSNTSTLSVAGASGGKVTLIPTSRNTAISYIDGIPVQTGNNAARLIGTYFTGAAGVSGQTEDSTTRKLVTSVDQLNQTNNATLLYTALGSLASAPTQYLDINGIHTTTTTGTTYSAVSKPDRQDYRLSLTSGNPTPTADQNAQSTIYLTPAIGDQLSLYETATNSWTTYRQGEISISVPGSQFFRVYNVYVYDNSGVPTLYLDPYDNGGQVTGNITACTAANPPVLTTSSSTASVSVGSIIGIQGGVGTMFTDVSNGLNDHLYKVSAKTGTTITLTSPDNTTGLTYTSGGNWYLVPTTPTTGQTYQNGVQCRTGDLGKRFVGTFRTNGSGSVDDSYARRNLNNVNNQQAINGYAFEQAASWTDSAAGARKKNLSQRMGYQYGEYVLANQQNIQITDHMYTSQSATPQNYLADTLLDETYITAGSSPAVANGTYIASLQANTDSTIGPHFYQRIETNLTATAAVTSTGASGSVYGYTTENTTVTLKR